MLSFNIENSEIIFHKKFIYKVNPDIITLISGFNKKWFISENAFPFYKTSNNIERDLFFFIYGVKSDNIKIIYKNGNPRDLTKENIDFFHKYDDIIRKKYTVINYIQGHCKNNGLDAYTLKNPIWQIEEDKYIMYCEKNKEVILDKTALNKIKEFEEINKEKNTYSIGVNGYVQSSPSKIYMHQIIMKFYGNGKGTKDLSIDHIDRNPLNNSFSNLRIVSREEQEQNSKGVMENTKRARKKSAKPLPEGLTQEMMPKYVVYYRDYADKEKTRERQYFKIEKHPKLDKPYISSKSNNKTLMEKLQEVEDVIHKLDTNTPIISPEKPYPAGLRIKDGFMIFDKKIDDKRCNMKGKMNSSKSEEENIAEFMKKVNEKYGLV